jgi:hypothetical protein
VRLYQARDFAAAADVFWRCKEVDAPSQVLYARCLELAADPPPADWDGVHVMRHK